MIQTVHERRADTGFTTAQLGLYLFLAADAMFYGALYSSHALLRTAAATWGREQAMPIAALGGLALVAVLAGAVCPRVGARPLRNTLVATVVTTFFLALLMGALVYLGASPATSTFFALVHLYAAVTALHTLGAAVAALVFARREQREPDSPGNIARRRLLGTFNAATAVFWAAALALVLFV